MKTGDIVRFWRGQHVHDRSGPHIGLLIEYHTWEKIARVLYEGKVISLRAEDVEKAGKKDFE
tara:strand:- start:2729 stop:2914 length:186 start_codon:yes stop_codon:yes gene_type:complete